MSSSASLFLCSFFFSLGGPGAAAAVGSVGNSAGGLSTCSSSHAELSKSCGQVARWRFYTAASHCDLSIGRHCPQPGVGAHHLTSSGALAGRAWSSSPSWTAIAKQPANCAAGPGWSKPAGPQSDAIGSFSFVAPPCLGGHPRKMKQTPPAHCAVRMPCRAVVAAIRIWNEDIEGTGCACTQSRRTRRRTPQGMQRLQRAAGIV